MSGSSTSTLKSTFNSYADAISNSKGKNFCDTQINDETVGYFKVDRSITRYVEWLENHLCKESRNNIFSFTFPNDKLKTFAIILESPHINEFQKNRKPSDTYGDHPAMGKTGEFLNQYFIDYLNKFIPTIYNDNQSKFDSANDVVTGIYKLVLINLVQFQCSLGETKRTTTNKMLTKCIGVSATNEIFIEDFKRRVSFHKPDVILNACTNAKHKRVWTLLKDFKCIKIDSFHPSIWNDNLCFVSKK